MDRNDDRVKAAMNLAAMKAMEVYAETIKDALGEEGLVEVLDGARHLHSAVMLVGDKDDKSLAALCSWRFTTDVEALKRLLALRTEGTTPS